MYLIFDGPKGIKGSLKNGHRKDKQSGHGWPSPPSMRFTLEWGDPGSNPACGLIPTSFPTLTLSSTLSTILFSWIKGVRCSKITLNLASVILSSFELNISLTVPPHYVNKLYKIKDRSFIVFRNWVKTSCCCLEAVCITSQASNISLESWCHVTQAPAAFSQYFLVMS